MMAAHSASAKTQCANLHGLNINFAAQDGPNPVVKPSEPALYVEALGTALIAST